MSAKVVTEASESLSFILGLPVGDRRSEDDRIEQRAERSRGPGELQPHRTVGVPDGDDRKKQVVLQARRQKVSGLKLLRHGPSRSFRTPRRGVLSLREVMWISPRTGQWHIEESSVKPRVWLRDKRASHLCAQGTVLQAKMLINKLRTGLFKF